MVAAHKKLYKVFIMSIASFKHPLQAMLFGTILLLHNKSYHTCQFVFVITKITEHIFAENYSIFKSFLFVSGVCFS